MKNFIITMVISSILWSCGGGDGDDSTPPPPVNKVPTTPILVYPTNNLLCIDNVLTFQWNASIDSDGDAITYQIDIAKNNQFSPIISTYNSSTINILISLEKGIAYYWRVKATDSKNGSSDYSATNQFYTEGVGESNHLPFSPVLVAPTLNSIVQSATTTLTWDASDVDNDSLTYTIYFGTAQSPTEIISQNQSAKSLNVNVTASTTYFWKVVVKDDKGGQTFGQIWSFKTN